VKQQKLDLNEFKEKANDLEAPKVKYTTKVLELRKNLSNLIKVLIC
jgi:hypothetical protein